MVWAMLSREAGLKDTQVTLKEVLLVLGSLHPFMPVTRASRKMAILGNQEQRQERRR